MGVYDGVFPLLIIALKFGCILARCYDDYDDKCWTCNSDYTACIDCKRGYYLSNGVCYSCSTGCEDCNSWDDCDDCEYGYYLSNSNCYSCQSPCYSCSSATYCNTCRDGYYYYSSGSCYSFSDKCNTCTNYSYYNSFK